MKQIPLTQGKFAIVDDSDYEYLNQFKWCAHRIGNTFYADRMGERDGKNYTELMHRVILNITDSNVHCDHINHNGLDNRRCNIRICTRSQNGMNRKRYANSSSIYKGVTYRKDMGKWTARIRLNNKNKSLGIFNNEYDAAKRYDLAAIEYYGEFANLNFK